MYEPEDKGQLIDLAEGTKKSRSSSSQSDASESSTDSIVRYNVFFISFENKTFGDVCLCVGYSEKIFTLVYERKSLESKISTHICQPYFLVRSTTLKKISDAHTFHKCFS